MDQPDARPGKRSVPSFLLPLLLPLVTASCLLLRIRQNKPQLLPHSTSPLPSHFPTCLPSLLVSRLSSGKPHRSSTFNYNSTTSSHPIAQLPVPIPPIARPSPAQHSTAPTGRAHDSRSTRAPALHSTITTLLITACDLIS
jgi:hypothetical protein